MAAVEAQLEKNQKKRKRKKNDKTTTSGNDTVHGASYSR